MRLVVHHQLAVALSAQELAQEDAEWLSQGLGGRGRWLRAGNDACHSIGVRLPTAEAQNVRAIAEAAGLQAQLVGLLAHERSPDAQRRPAFKLLIQLRPQAN